MDHNQPLLTEDRKQFHVVNLYFGSSLEQQKIHYIFWNAAISTDCTWSSNLVISSSRKSVPTCIKNKGKQNDRSECSNWEDTLEKLLNHQLLKKRTGRDWSSEFTERTMRWLFKYAAPPTSDCFFAVSGRPPCLTYWSLIQSLHHKSQDRIAGPITANKDFINQTSNRFRSPVRAYS